MDRNTISGLVLIFVILIGFSYFNKPSKEEVEAAKRKRDSIEQVQAEQQRIAEQKAKEVTTPKEQEKPDSTVANSTSVENRKDEYGAFGDAAVGTEKFITMENNLMKVKVSTKGGRIYSVELKDYKTYDGKPLILFKGDANRFGLNFFSQNRSIETDNLYFTPSVSEDSLVVTGPKVPKGKEGRIGFNEDHPGKSKTLTMRVNAGNGKFIEYVYTMKYNSYMMGFNIRSKGLSQLTGQNAYMSFNWAIDVPRQEKKSKYGEDRYTTIYYKYHQDEVNSLSSSKSDSKDLTTAVKWIGFKQLFFSSILIADNSFTSAKIKNDKTEDNPNYLGHFSADVSIPVDNAQTQEVPMEMFFGPNQYNVLKQYKLQLDQELNLGWTVIGWVNKYIVIPAFDFLRRYINNFGIIILLLTIYIKLIISPFTYKSFLSQAKMRALKPEIDEIKAKYGKDKSMEAQQATMALYKKAGVNPMGGCLPMLFQFPILIAMFRFFPVSIELRQQSFLWAHDLSSYDSIFHLPFTIPFYGDHVSLFCLLMTVTNVFYIKMNNEMNAAGTQQMPGMKTMMYMMPVMFLFIFNNYAAGLSLYYFLSLLFTFLQMFIFKKAIDEDKIRKQITAKQKKPAKKSKFQKRLEDMARQRGMEAPKK
ncbi:membrane protein insertase YidC [Prolixibacter bellariivorans]|uniref:Membrane protein insertase YidC n=1 Tax=Prolixibacter bellariivorans TaxID=314319 RepID=A0A5M4B2T1_9BACT|nr:membrane protein insertase YidC [Prolixibacter bellariivorans]GET34384.1 membrane protein insertase YidC [Prolixibacter bellariivorans]